ncbi:hypothetical protein SEPCBS57363_001086 [Sporothrix epigloea]|uniref:Uncharacterized protein n=1 Tax=Sporothrix epigloea TaxID=1892477 RepID=A0ABP0D8B7_9PEZI
MAPEQWLQPTEQGQQILSMLMRLQIDIEFDLVEATRDCVRSSGMHELALLTNREKAELTHWCRVLDSIEQPTLQTNVARNGRLLLFWMGRRAIQNILNRVIYSAEPREVLEDRTPDSEQAFVPDPPTEEELALFFAEHPCDEDDEDNEDDGEEEGYREIYGEEFEEESEEQPEEQSDEHTGEDEEDEVEPEAEEDEEEDHQSIIDTVVDDSENGLDDEDEEGYMRHDLSLIYTADQQSQLFCQLDERLRILQLHMLNDTHDTLSALEQFEREPRCPPWPRLMRPRFSWAPTPQPEWGPSPAYHPSTMFTNPPSPSNMTSAHSIMIPLLPEINPAHPHMVSDTTVQDLDPLPPYPGAHTRVPRTVGEAGELELAGQRVELPPAYFRTLSLGDMSDRLVARCISAVAGQRIKEPWMVSRKAILRRVVLLSRCYLRRARDRHRVTELHDSGVCYDFDFDDECEMSEESPDSVAGTRAESGSEEREEGIEDRIMSLLRSIRDLIKRILWRNQTM